MATDDSSDRPRPERPAARRTPDTAALRRARGKIARRGRRQLAVVTLDQMRQAGLSPSSVYRDIERGRLTQLWPGVFGVSGAPDGRERRWLAALLFVGGAAALSHQTAASVYGLEHGLPSNRIHLTVSVRCPKPRKGLIVHRSSTFVEDGVVGVGPLLVTSAARTLTDLAGSVDEARLRKLVAAAIRERITDDAELQRTIDRRKRFAGRTTLRRLLAELSPLMVEARTAAEGLLVEITTRAGIPPVGLNVPRKDVNGITRYVDGLFEEGVAVEIDSLRFHGHPA